MHLEKAVEVHPRNAIILKSLGEVSGLCGYSLRPRTVMLDCCGIPSIRIPPKARNGRFEADRPRLICNPARLCHNVHADPDSHTHYTRSTNASRTQTMRSSCTIGRWHSSPTRRCVCTDGPSCSTHRGNIRWVCPPSLPLSTSPFHPCTCRRCLIDIPLTETLWDFDMTAVLLDFDHPTQTKQIMLMNARLLNTTIFDATYSNRAKWGIGRHPYRLFYSCMHGILRL
jgi:hypothetical protein